MKKEELMEEVCSRGDPDNSKKAQCFYDIFFPWRHALSGMRGDTICTFGATFGKSNKNTAKELKPLVKGPNWDRRYTKELFQSDCVDEILEFRKIYHSLANFWVIPSSLNSWRGMLDLSGNLPAQGDYIDLFLALIRIAYLEVSIPNPVYQKFNENMVKEWLHFFGTDESGWRNFIDQNFLNMYVTKDQYLIKDIFSPKFIECDDDLVGSYHVYGKALPQFAMHQSAVDNAKYFTKNSLWAIEQRAHILVQSDQ